MMFFSLALPAMLGAAWFAVNLSYIASQKSDLQAAADAAALAAAKQMTLSGQTTATIQQVASNMAVANLPANPYVSAADVVTANVNTGTSSVTVTIKRTLLPMLGANLGVFSNVVTATSTAQYKSTPICALILEPTAPAAINLKAASSISGPGCSVISNSTSSTGITSTSVGTFKTTKTCSGGGYTGNGYTPQPITDCPPVPDPLASRSPPSNVNNACDHVNYKVIFSAQVLQPGVYCGGITILIGAVQFAPGDYIIRGGSLDVAVLAGIKGTGVGFYFTGGATINAQALTALQLSAPSDPNDAMVGLVFWEDPKNSSGAPLTHKIASDFGENLEGTAYFPQGTLYIGGNAKMGQTSNYTIIVAHDLITDATAQVVLNTNYMASPVPVPKGVGNTMGQLSLAK